MKIPFYKTNSDFRESLFAIYIHISICAILLFSLLFYRLGFIASTRYQLLGILPFVLSFYLLKKRHVLLAKCLTFSTSIGLVIYQTVWIFSNSSGFHIQFFALLVVLFLTSNLMDPKHQNLVFIFTIVIFLSFFFCQSVSPNLAQIQLSLYYQQQFYTLSISITFLALVVLLYLYAKQLSIKESELFYLAKHDALTGILNRGSFNDLGENSFPKMQN